MGYKNDNLGTRMKEFYENISKTKLIRRMPVAVRLDGKAFHTFTRGFQKPFDRVLMNSMQKTMRYLCENIQGCVFGYTQSDEITLILIDYKKINSSAWFDYEVQKMCSIAASMTTMAFNKFFTEEVEDYTFEYQQHGIAPQDIESQQEMKKYLDTLYAAKNKGAMFDARCFNIPREEVTNLVYWRQLDASRNSIQMVGQANFSHRELQNKTCNDIQDMLMIQKRINWNDFPIDCKRGAACIKNIPFGKWGLECLPFEDIAPNVWVIDKKMPILKGEDRRYLDNLIDF